MRFEGRLRLLGRAPVVPLLELLPSISEAVWLHDPFRQQAFKVHRQTRSLIFRHIPGDDPAACFDLPPWLAWRKMLEPVLAAITAACGPGRACRIMLASLPASREIIPHRDHGPAYERTRRIHVPLQTDPRVRFAIDGEDFYLEAGGIYEVNNMLEHGVVNGSEVDRVHLIVDYLAHDADSAPRAA